MKSRKIELWIYLVAIIGILISIYIPLNKHSGSFPARDISDDKNW